MATNFLARRAVIKAHAYGLTTCWLLLRQVDVRVVVRPVEVDVAPLLTHHILMEKCILVLHTLAWCGLDTRILFLIERSNGHVSLADLVLDVVKAFILKL